MLLMPWQTVHVCATTSLPGPSGRSAAPPFLCPDAGTIIETKIAAAIRTPSEYFDISPPRETRSGYTPLSVSGKENRDDSGAHVVCGNRPDSGPRYGVSAAGTARQFDELFRHERRSGQGRQPRRPARRRSSLPDAGDRRGR